MEHLTQRDPKVRFLVNIAYWAVILGLVFLVLKYLVNLIFPVFLALILAAVVRPISKALSRKTKYIRGENGERIEVKRRFYMPRNLAGILSVLVLFLFVGGLAAVFAVRVVNAALELAAAVPVLYENTVVPGLSNLYDRILVYASRFDDSVIEMVQSLVPNLISSIGRAVTTLTGKVVTLLTSAATRLPNMLLNTIICLIATVFFAIDFDRIRSFIDENLPQRPLDFVRKVKNSFLQMIWQFLKSYSIIFIITVCEITLGLLIIGIKKPWIYGLIIGVFDAFPIVGSGMILLPWAVITLISGNSLRGLGLLIVYAVVVSARQVIEPKIVGKHVGLRPIVTLTCMFAGTKLFGGIGLFGLPIAAAIITDLNDQGIIHLFRRVPENELNGSETALENPEQLP